ncbi:PAS domain S-box protein [Candidatus Methylospira mobilis]|uniref:histidine kinase n=1 Tax=Candidatus Methylospira mobilis TaxID=1808979 RepID=A0A5Q0BP39_9GAMM|nr:ATP-binding protein [Candidatus Methylospira mobilis]QFY43858.1 PAS domain S-box protein [Candidatus Methylospira mobilis]
MQFIKFIGENGLMPHGYCLSWNPALLSLHVLSDVIIALSYYSIPVCLAYFVRRRKDLPYRRLFWMFGLFIVACGTTHLLATIIIWVPLYWLDGFAKAITALFSAVTAVAMVWIIPRALQLPTSVQLEAEIAERKKAQQEQQEVLDRLNKIAGLVPGVVFQFRLCPDGSSCIPYASEGLRTIYRVGPEQVREDASGVFAVVHPDDIENHLASIRISARDMTPWHQEYRLQFDDAAALWLLGSALPQLQPDGSILWHGFLIDITEQKELEEALRESALYTRSLIEASLDPLVTIGADGRIMDVSAATEKATGIARDALIGSDFCDYFTESGQARAGYQQVFEQGSVTDYPLVIRHVSGKLTDVLYNATLYRDTQGKVAGVFAAARDITARKKMEEELQRSNAELDQFAYAVSHDMRQPLRMVASYLTLLEKALAGRLDEDTREYLSYAIEGAKRMDQMILAMLDFSRVGRKTDPITPISSREVLDDTLAMLKSDIIAGDGAVEVTGDWPELVASRDELMRLLQNLIGNALKYHEPDQPPCVEVHAAATPALFRVTVRDRGIGIDPNQTERLFKVFSRLQARTRFEGTGVGLALCRKIVEHHGGRIGVESAGEGCGSTFWFELPRASAHEKSLRGRVS